MRRDFYVCFLLFVVLELQASKHHSRHHHRLRRALNAAIPQWNNPGHQNYRGNQYNSNQRGGSNNQPSLNIPWYHSDPSWYKNKPNFWSGIDPQWNQRDGSFYKWNLNVDKRTKVKRDCKTDTSNHRHHHKHHGRKSHDSIETQEIHSDDHHGSSTEPYPLHTFHHDGPHHFHHHGHSGYIPFSNNDTSNHRHHHKHHGHHKSHDSLESQDLHRDHFDHHGPPSDPYPLHTFHHYGSRKDGHHHFHHHGPPPPPPGDFPFSNNGTIVKGTQTLLPPLNTGTNHSISNATYAGDTLANGTVLSCKYPWIPTYKNGSTGKAIDLIHPWLPCNSTTVVQHGYNGIPIDVRFSEIPDLNKGEKAFPDP